MSHIWKDLEYAARQLRRSPAFTLVAVLALGIGVGANISIFGFVNAFMFRPVDAPQPDRLVRVFGEGGNTLRALATNSEAFIRLEDFPQFRERNQSFSDLAAHFIGYPTSVRIDGPAQMIPITPVSANYFETAGVPAARGRMFRDDDGLRGAERVVVLSDEGWRRFFNADPEIVGKTAVVDGAASTIVGVAPSWFRGTTAPMVPQIYVPLEGLAPEPGQMRVWLLGRLKAGVSVGEARADLLRVAAQLTTQDGLHRAIEVYPAAVLMPPMVAPLSLTAALFAVIVAVVLLIACDNIAILLLTRAALRRREIAVRLALGASRTRLVTQLLSESALLCGAGATVGLFVAHTTAHLLTQIYLPVPMPFALIYNLDWRVAGFTIGIAVAAMLLCGLAPLRQSLKADVVTALKASALEDGARLRAGLVATQTALSTALLVTAAVLGRSLMGPIAPDNGFVSRGVLMSTLSLNARVHDSARRAVLVSRVLEDLEAEAGVQSVAVVQNVPMANNNPTPPENARADGRIERVYRNSVSHGLFKTLGIPVLSGRDFLPQDTAQITPVGIVNETLSRRFWPGQNAIGRQLEDGDGALITIVGLVRDTKNGPAPEEPRALLYRPIAQSASFPTNVTFLIKTALAPPAVFSLVRTRVAALDPDLAPFNLMTLDDRLGLGRLANRASATVSGALGLLALVLGAIGIFGTMTFLVQQRRKEIGIRMALGATPWTVTHLMTSQGMRWTATGLALGLVGGLGAAVTLRRFLYGVVAADPLAFVVTPIVLGSVAYLACLIPARRASRLDPMITLREE
jgi:predicted permease